MTDQPTPQKASHRAYESGFRAGIDDTDEIPETDEYLRSVQVAGHAKGWRIRGRIGPSRLAELRGQTYAAQAVRLRDNLPESIAREPCVYCEWITVCAELATTCAAFRRYVSVGHAPGAVRPGPPDAEWYESWHEGRP